MTDYSRDRLGPDEEDRLPWLEPVEDEIYEEAPGLFTRIARWFSGGRSDEEDVEEVPPFPAEAAPAPAPQATGDRTATASGAARSGPSPKAREADPAAGSGKRTYVEQVKVIRSLAPIVIDEIDGVIAVLEARRFNDPETADALRHLRDLHDALGDLIAEAEAGRPLAQAFDAIRKYQAELSDTIARGAKLTIVAPAFTYGIVHMLSLITGVAIDSTMVTGVYGSALLYEMTAAFRNRRQPPEPGADAG